LVNDSNYFLSFAVARKGDNDREWTLVYAGEVAPNELIDLATFSCEELPGLDRVALQCVAYKRDRSFSMRPVVSVIRKLDLTKFYKLHCFRPGTYFDTPVIEIHLIKNDISTQPSDSGYQRLVQAADTIAADKKTATELGKKYRIDSRKTSGKRDRIKPEDNPNKLLPLIEVDLHIAELVDTTAGMEAKDMLALQIDTMRHVMEQNKRRIGQKIVFIHGKGDGVLRKEVLKVLGHEYPKAEVQDASFREYGFGATLVTIH
jgi:hypothetical protein